MIITACKVKLRNYAGLKLLWHFLVASAALGGELAVCRSWLASLGGGRALGIAHARRTDRLLLKVLGQLLTLSIKYHLDDDNHGLAVKFPVVKISHGLLSPLLGLENDRGEGFLGHEDLLDGAGRGEDLEAHVVR